MPQLDRWIATQPKCNTVWIIGGGSLVDTVRVFENNHTDARVDADTAHWISIDLMSITARLFKTLKPDWPVVQSLTHLEQANAIFDCSQWARREEALPQNWHTTSDAIAAAIARDLHSHALILLKSRDAAGSTVQENRAQGVIDEAFCAPPHCRTQIVNLRSPSFETTTIDNSSAADS